MAKKTKKEERLALLKLPQIRKVAKEAGYELTKKKKIEAAQELYDHLAGVSENEVDNYSGDVWDWWNMVDVLMEGKADTPKAAVALLKKEYKKDLKEEEKAALAVAEAEEDKKPPAKKKKPKEPKEVPIPISAHGMPKAGPSEKPRSVS